MFLIIVYFSDHFHVLCQTMGNMTEESFMSVLVLIIYASTSKTYQSFKNYSCYGYMIFDVLMVVTIRTIVFWNVTPWSLLYRNLPIELHGITSQKTVIFTRSHIVALFLNASMSNLNFF
jgi:hypothetical protein